MLYFTVYSDCVGLLRLTFELKGSGVVLLGVLRLQALAPHDTQPILKRITSTGCCRCLSVSFIHTHGRLYRDKIRKHESWKGMQLFSLSGESVETANVDSTPLSTQKNVCKRRHGKRTPCSGEVAGLQWNADEGCCYLASERGCSAPRYRNITSGITEGSEIDPQRYYRWESFFFRRQSPYCCACPAFLFPIVYLGHVTSRSK